MRWFRPKGDLQKFFESLSPAKVGFGYTETDRYRDFREVFSTPQGRRVLHQIIDYCEGLPRSEHDADQIHRNNFRDGRRDAGLWIIRRMNAVPLDKPGKTESEE